MQRSKVRTPASSTTSTTDDGGFGILATVEFFEGTPPAAGTYLVARYRSPNSPRNVGEFLDVASHHWNGTGWNVGWQNDHFIEIKYWAYMPDNPEEVA